jgi:hypothetical protein
MDLEELEAILILASQYGLQSIKIKDFECSFWEPINYKQPPVGIFVGTADHIVKDEEDDEA